jgi:hypothetical protein
MSYFRAITQDVKASTVNSSTTPLTAKGTYTFTISSATAAVGDTYTNNSITYTVFASIAGETSIIMYGSGAPTASGNLVRATGSGTNPIVFSAATKSDEFIGTSESTLGVVGLQVSLYTGRNCTVYVEQSPNGTNWDISDIYSYRYQSHPNFGKTIQAVNSYFRVRVQNEYITGGTGAFRLQSCLCPIVESVPRSLSEEGNLKVGVYEIEDEVGNKVKISPNGALKVCKVVRLVGSTFAGTTIDASFWVLAAAANGSGVQTGGQYELRTITAPATSSPNGSATLQSQRTGRYINGVPNLCGIQADYGGVGVNNNTKRWGCFTGTLGSPTDGVMFELINQVPTLATYNGGVANRISNGSFNGQYGTTLDTIPSGVQTFEIIFNNRYVYFYFNNMLVHKIEAVSAPWSSTLSLPLRAENYNTDSSTTDTSLKIRSFVLMRLGEAESKSQWKYTHGALSAANGILKRSGGTLHSIVNGNNKGTMSIYDAISATNPIAIIDLTTVLGTQVFNLDFYTGLTIVQTDAASDTTVIFE